MKNECGDNLSQYIQKWNDTTRTREKPKHNVIIIIIIIQPTPNKQWILSSIFGQCIILCVFLYEVRICFWIVLAVIVICWLCVVAACCLIPMIIVVFVVTLFRSIQFFISFMLTTLKRWTCARLFKKWWSLISV